MEKDKEPETSKPSQRTSISERMNDVSSMRIQIDGKWVDLIDNKEERKTAEELDKL